MNFGAFTADSGRVLLKPHNSQPVPVGDFEIW